MLYNYGKNLYNFRFITISGYLADAKLKVFSLTLNNFNNSFANSCYFCYKLKRKWNRRRGYGLLYGWGVH